MAEGGVSGGTPVTFSKSGVSLRGSWSCSWDSLLKITREKYVKKIIFLNVLWTFLAVGLMSCIGLEPIQKREEIYGKAASLIHQSYAARQIWPGETWKVFLNASDPDGDMKNIVCTIDQAGVGTYPVSITKISEANQKQFSGYVYLNTQSIDDLDFVTLTLTVHIQDKAGHYSEPAIFPLLLSGTSLQEPPPPGVFQEVSLGPIMIQLRTIRDDGGPFDRGLFFRGRSPFGH